MFFPLPLVTPIVRTVNLADCWDRARHRVGIKHDALAALLGIPATQVSAQLRGKGHPSLWRLLMALNDQDGWRFVWAFFDEIALEAGRESDDALDLIQRADAALRLERRMAKADLRCHEERKHA